jgi:hypothetical protein
LPLAVILIIFLVTGAVAGVAVISIIVPWGDSPDLVGNWVSAGAVSGAVTSAIISLIYRWTLTSAEPGTAQNGGLASPVNHAKPTERPPSVS